MLEASQNSILDCEAVLPVIRQDFFPYKYYGTSKALIEYVTEKSEYMT